MFGWLLLDFDFVFRCCCALVALGGSSLACGIMFLGGLLACTFYVPLTPPTADDGDNGR